MERKALYKRGINYLQKVSGWAVQAVYKRFGINTFLNSTVSRKLTATNGVVPKCGPRRVADIHFAIIIIFEGYTAFILMSGFFFNIFW